MKSISPPRRAVKRQIAPQAQATQVVAPLIQQLVAGEKARCACCLQWFGLADIEIVAAHQPDNAPQKAVAFCTQCSALAYGTPQQQASFEQRTTAYLNGGAE